MRADQWPPAKVKKKVGCVGVLEPRVEVRYLLVVPKGANQPFKWDSPAGWMENRERHRRYPPFGGSSYGATGL